MTLIDDEPALAGPVLERFLDEGYRRANLERIE